MSIISARRVPLGQVLKVSQDSQEALDVQGLMGPKEREGTPASEASLGLQVTLLSGLSLYCTDCCANWNKIYRSQMIGFFIDLSHWFRDHHTETSTLKFKFLDYFELG